ncbi:MAG TPA: M15 family metallopeptidase [Actinomycetota bacterium]
MSFSFRRAPLLALAVAFVVGGLGGPAAAWHYGQRGWRDWHANYPRRPSGYAAIVNRFGQPCSNAASKISMQWRAADNGVYYTVRFHRKLGGMKTEMVADKGGVSTNLDNDVHGHIRNEHLGKHTKSGIWGYNCRLIAGSSSYSTHAWGIAVDVSSAYDVNGLCGSVENKYHAQIWKDHRWRWGKAWCDPMHFQYASDY